MSAPATSSRMITVEPTIVPRTTRNPSERRHRLASQPGAERILYLADAFRAGMPAQEIQAISGIDPWFLAHIEERLQGLCLR